MKTKEVVLHAALIRKSLEKATKMWTNGRGQRHVNAWLAAVPSSGRSLKPGDSIVRLVEAMAQYADAHRHQFDSGIGEDYVLGPEWEKIGRAVLALLNGDCGALDCGMVDGLVRDMLKAEGFDHE